jgi:CHAT domain/Two component regulator propeller
MFEFPRLGAACNLTLPALRCFITYLVRCAFVSGVPFAVATYALSDPYDDPRIVDWSKEFASGQQQNVLQSVEGDLRSGSPHPFAAHVWVVTQDSLGQLDNSYSRLTDSVLQNSLGPLPKIYSLYRVGDFQKAVSLYPASQASQLSDTWSLLLLAECAHRVTRYKDEFAYLVSLTKLEPAMFGVGWRMFEAADKDEEIRTQVLNLLKDGGVFASLWAKPLGRLLQFRPADEQEELIAAREWLSSHPRDVQAMQILAMLYSKKEWFADADKIIAEAETTYPFFDKETNYGIHSVALLRMSRVEEAKRLASSCHLRPIAHCGTEEASLCYFVQDCLNAGELGKARASLSAGCNRWPANAELRSLFADLEIRSRQYEAACKQAETAVRAAPENESFRLQFVKALHLAKKLNESFNEWQQLRVRISEASIEFFDIGQGLLADLNRQDERLSLCQNGIRSCPGSVALLNAEAEALIEEGNLTLARARLLDDINGQPGSQALYATLRTCLGKLIGNDKTDAEMENIRTRFCWSPGAWLEGLAKVREKGDPQRELDYWKQAMASSNNRWWAVSGAIRLYLEHTTEINLNSANKLVIQWLRAATKDNDRSEVIPAGDYNSALVAYGTLIRLRVENRTADLKLVNTGLVALQKALENDATVADCLKSACVLQLAAGNSDATRSAVVAFNLDPDDGGHLFSLFTRFNLSASELFVMVHRYLDRDSFDGGRLQTAIQLHAMYGGSAIVALQLIKKIRRVAPDVDVDTLESTARHNLGDFLKAYELVYTKTNKVIGPSERYLSWYDSARQCAQGEANVLDDSELETKGRIKLILPDGESIELEDHPVSARRTFYKRGAAFVQAQYNDDGQQLQAITSSSGTAIQFLYGDHGELRQIESSTGSNLTLKYGTDAEVESVVDNTGKEIKVRWQVTNRSLVLTPEPDENGNAPLVDAAAKMLLGFTKYLNTDISDLTDIPIKDSTLDALQSECAQKEGEYNSSKTAACEGAFARARIALASYLINHLQDGKNRDSDARNLLEGIIELAQKSDWGSGAQVETVSAIELWHGLIQRTRKEGLSTRDWETWLNMKDWLWRNSENAPHLTVRLLRKLEEPENQLRLIGTAGWLDKSYIGNDGYWRRYRISEIVPSFLASDVTCNTILVRANNDVVVGTNFGLCVLRRGFWEWFGFDETSGRFSGSIAPDLIRGKASSNVLSLAEDSEGNLWVGTGNGLFHLVGDYDSRAEICQLTGGELAEPRIDHLLTLGDTVLVGSESGLWQFAKGHSKPITFPDLEGRAILFLQGPISNGETVPVALIGTQTDVFALSEGRVVRLLNIRATQAGWDPVDGTLFLLHDGEIWKTNWDGRKIPDAATLFGMNDVIRANSRERYGFSSIPLDDGKMALCLNTDNGLFIYHDGHFEHRRLPLADRTATVWSCCCRNLRTYLISSEGIYALERGQTLGDNWGWVYDILNDDAQETTFVARGDSLQAVNHRNRAVGAQTLDSIKATMLAEDPQGRLIANDGTGIVRYSLDGKKRELLFDARPSARPADADELNPPSTITGLLAASDGSIWATAGWSAFRWKDGEMSEYSLFLDSEKFPIHTDMVSRVFETVDHHIWIVGSDESHRRYRGAALEGGVVEWDGSSFHRVYFDNPNNGYWFIRSYTPVDDNRAIVGTVPGFSEHQNGHYVNFRQSNELSYNALVNRNPFVVMLGTKGAKLGDDTWLFGTAAGIVAYRDGNWFFPDRLNRLLPDDYLAQFGSRMVHAIAVDKDGFIYAGTDRGVLIYDSGGGDPMSFLVSNQFDQEAFAAVEMDKLRKSSQLILAQIDPKSKKGEAVKSAEKLKSEIEQLELKLAPGFSLSKDKPPTEEDRQKLADLREEQRQFLVQIQWTFPDLYKMLEVKPLELRALRSDLSEDQAIVEYLPTKDKLFIQVVTSQGSLIREVDVKKDDLNAQAEEVAWLLGRGKSNSEIRPDSTSDPRGVEAGRVISTPDLRGDLSYLYDQLLRPIEDCLKDRQEIFIVPVGALNYIPFGALVRTVEGKSEYAVQKFSFGFLPSLYVLDLVLHHQKSSLADALVIGDPDGTLPGAKAEAELVSHQLGGTLPPYIGSDATVKAFSDNCSKVRILHLAAHGFLDPSSPGDSYLKLSDGILKFTTIINYDLSQTDLVVLSACETGRGETGFEYVTLAESFAYGKAASVLATLWRVNDEASRSLMSAFYQRYLSDHDCFRALAGAQRDMLQSGDDFSRSPSSWAAYVPFGSP